MTFAANARLIELAREAGVVGTVPDCINSGKYLSKVTGEGRPGISAPRRPSRSTARSMTHRQRMRWSARSRDRGQYSRYRRRGRHPACRCRRVPRLCASGGGAPARGQGTRPRGVGVCAGPVPDGLPRGGRGVVEGQWRVVDATLLAPRQSLVRITTGRDAADTAFLDNHKGAITLNDIAVTAVVDGNLPKDLIDQLMSIG